MKFQLKTISPLHIGDGNEILPFEYTINEGVQGKVKELWVLSLEKVQETNPQQLQFALRNKSKWLSISSHDDKGNFFLPEKECIRYTARIGLETLEALREDLKKGNKGEIKTFIKLPDDRPYIPGSSLKGAIRTAIAYYALFKNDDPSPFEQWITNLENPKKSNPDITEKVVFRPQENSAHYDLLKVLQVTDSTPLPKNDTVTVAQLRRVSGKELLNFKNYREILRRKLTVSFEMSMNTNLLKPLDAPSWFPRTTKEILRILNEWSLAVAEHEKSYFTSHPLRRRNSEMANHLDQILKFYESLLEELKDLTQRTNPSKAYLSLGFGTGWVRKTLGTMLRSKKPDLFKELFREKKFGFRKKGKQDPRYYPTSREILVESGQWFVMGWVEISHEA